MKSSDVFPPPPPPPSSSAQPPVKRRSPSCSNSNHDLRAPQPTRVLFDPFNSSASGHQRAENRASSDLGWRKLRTMKMRSQLGDLEGRGGTEWIYGMAGVGDEWGLDDREKAEAGKVVELIGMEKRLASGKGGQGDIRDFMGGVGKRKLEGLAQEHGSRMKKKRLLDSVIDARDLADNGRRKSDADNDAKNDLHDLTTTTTTATKITRSTEDEEAWAFTTTRTTRRTTTTTTSTEINTTTSPASVQLVPTPGLQSSPPILSPPPVSVSVSISASAPLPLPPAQIFRSLTLYINGSTAPLISDHRLKQLFVQHGGSVAIRLARRTVTHVVIGQSPSSGKTMLAAGKVQKELGGRKVGGMKYVSANWVVDSVHAGKRLGESQYAVGVGASLAGVGGGGVAGRGRGTRALFEL